MLYNVSGGIFWLGECFMIILMTGASHTGKTDKIL